MFTYPYEILKLRLSAITELREFDWYMGQDNVKDKNADIKAAPALYLQFAPVTMSNLGQRIQTATVEFEAILITDCVLDTGSKRLKKDLATDHMRLFDRIYQELDGFSAKLSYLPAFASLPEGDDQRVMNSISRIGIPSPPHIPSKALMKSVQTFRTQMWDHSRIVPRTTPAEKPTVEVTITPS